MLVMVVANGGSGIVIVRYQIGISLTLQKQLVVILVSMVVKPFIPLQLLETFAAPSPFTITTAEYVVVAGGGAGGAAGGGGGAGGYRVGTSTLRWPVQILLQLVLVVLITNGASGNNGGNSVSLILERLITAGGGGGGNKWSTKY